MDNDKIWQKFLLQPRFCKDCNTTLTVNNITLSSIRHFGYVCTHCRSIRQRRYNKDYRETHREQCKEWSERYTATHKEKLKERQKRYYQRHIEKFRAYTRLQSYRNQQAKQQLLSMSDEEFLQYIKAQGYLQ